MSCSRQNPRPQLLTSLPNTHRFPCFLPPSPSQISTLICLLVNASLRNPLAKAIESVKLGNPFFWFVDDDAEVEDVVDVGEPRYRMTFVVLYTVWAIRRAS
jgi:hypothetical protein